MQFIDIYLRMYILRINIEFVPKAPSSVNMNVTIFSWYLKNKFRYSLHNVIGNLAVTVSCCEAKLVTQDCSQPNCPLTLSTGLTGHHITQGSVPQTTSWNVIFVCLQIKPVICTPHGTGHHTQQLSPALCYRDI